MFVANRRRERAIALARRFGGSTIAFDALPGELERADIVVASTASPHSIVGAEELALVTAARGGRPLLLLDLAVPRDIDPDCAALPGVTLVDIDGLQAQVARTHSERRIEARRAEGIVEEEIQSFAGWLGTLEVLPTIAALREQADRLVAELLAENEQRWESLASATASASRRCCAPPSSGCCTSRRSASRRSTPSAATRGSRCCASCSGSTSRRRRSGPRPRCASSAARAALSAAAAAGDARQRARARAGPLGRGAAAGRGRRWSRSTTAGDLAAGRRATSRAGPARSSARSSHGEIDIAVHSAKDVPGELAEGTEIAAVPPRADPRDVLVGAASLDALPQGARVGTSALRRRAQLLAVRPDLDVVELRGNVDTRLRKLADGEVDALVLAAAGLARLGRDDVAAAPLEGAVFVPAPGQGCLAVQARAGDALRGGRRPGGARGAAAPSAPSSRAWTPPATRPVGVHSGPARAARVRRPAGRLGVAGRRGAGRGRAGRADARGRARRTCSRARRRSA